MSPRAYPVDEQAEREIAERLSHHWQSGLLRMPRYSRVDWMAVRQGTCWAVVEAKTRRRDREHDKPDVMLSCDKWMTLRLVAASCLVQPLLVVRFADGVMRIANLASIKPTRLGFGGRTDRNDPDDLEPCAWFAVDDMTRVSRR